MTKFNMDKEEIELINDIDIRKDFKEQYYNEIGLEPTEEELTDYMKDFFFSEENINLSNKASDSPFSKVFSFLFVVWFIASLIGMLHFVGEENTIMLFVMIGQFFLVFGIMATISLISTAGLINFGNIFILVGLGIMIVPILIEHPELLSFKVDWEFLGVFTFGLVLTVAGLWLFFLPVITNKRLKKKCSLTVWGNVISINEFDRPVYEYQVAEKTYKIAGQKDRNYSIGEKVQLMVNPDKPRERFYVYNFKENVFTHLFAIPFILSGIFVMIMAFVNF